MPISPWTIGVALGGTALAAVIYRPVARRLGLRRRSTAVAMVSTAVVLALTVTPDGSRPALGLAACIPTGWRDIPVDIASSGGGAAGYLLNVLLFLPLAAALVVSSRRLWPGLALGAVPPLIELVQTELPGRSCSLTDVLANLTGVTLGAVAGVAGNRWLRARGCERDAVADISV